MSNSLHYRRLTSTTNNILIITIIVLLGVCISHVQAQTSTDQWRIIDEHWYVLEIAGGKAGWTSIIVQSDGEHYRTATEMSIRLSRGSIPIEMVMRSEFTETKEGKPVLVKTSQKASLQTMMSQWKFNDDHVLMISEQGGRETVKQEPLPQGEWLTPQAAKRYEVEQRKAGAEMITYRTIDPSNGFKPITITSKRTVGGQETLEIDGKQVEVTVWVSTTDIMPIDSIEKIDANNTRITTESTLPGLGKMTTRLTSKAQAMGGGGDGGADVPAPELLLQTFITPDKPIDQPMKTVRAKLRLTVKEGTMPALPSAGAQRVEMNADGKSAVLMIDINDSIAASAEDEANAEYLSASAMIDSEDALIQKLAKRGVDGAGDDAMKRATALHKFAHRHISRKGMETAFASASETAKTKAGDCSEHGVFLAALLRAANIPARVATGLVYVDQFEGHEGIFGWHMWTQALIDGKWVDFDATLPKRYNAVHVLTSTSSLADNLGASEMASVLQLLGNLEIEVLEVERE